MFCQSAFMTGKALRFIATGQQPCRDRIDQPCSVFVVFIVINLYLGKVTLISYLQVN